MVVPEVETKFRFKGELASIVVAPHALGDDWQTYVGYVLNRYGDDENVKVLIEEPGLSAEKKGMLETRLKQRALRDFKHMETMHSRSYLLVIYKASAIKCTLRIRVMEDKKMAERYFLSRSEGGHRPTTPAGISELSGLGERARESRREIIVLTRNVVISLGGDGRRIEKEKLIGVIKVYLKAIGYEQAKADEKQGAKR